MNSEAWFTVSVVDNLTGSIVCVGDFLTRTEAMKLSRCIGAFQACKVVVENSEFKRSFDEE